MDKKHLKFIKAIDKQLKFMKAIEDLRTIIMKSTEENEVDSFLDNLEKQAAENKRKIEDLGNV